MSRQWLATGAAEAPVNAVFATLLAAGPVAGAHHNPAHNTNAAVDSDGILRYQAPIGNPPNTATVEVDQNRHTLAIQGHCGTAASTPCARTHAAAWSSTACTTSPPAAAGPCR
jgi:hypothetical protein